MGTEEVSFRVTTPEGEPFNLAFFRVLARRFGQHSILWVNGDGAAFLDYCDGNMEHLGTMKKVTRSVGLAAWSKIGGEIYTVVK
jgi:hypothetical protein